MSTPTPRTDAIYIEHRYWANEDEATEAIEDFRDLARTLERELAAEQAYISALEDQLDAYGLVMARKQAGREYKL